MTDVVKGVCSELLSDLDEDIFDYIVGILEDVDFGASDDLEDTTEMISGLLSSAEYCASEEDATELSKKLLSRLGGGNTASSGPSSSFFASNDNTPLKTIKALKIQDTMITSMGKTKEAFVPIKELKEGDEAVSKKAQRLANRRGGGGTTAGGGNSKNRGGSGKKTKPTALELAEKEAAELETELVAARIASVRQRTLLGAYRGALDATSFTLPNPGGGMPLLEDAACRMVWGKRYGLIGRNGVGKSTLLKAMAARRVGDVPSNVTVHYVSQEVSLTETQRQKTPCELVVDGDIERNLLTEEKSKLEDLASRGELDEKGSRRHGEVLSRLDEIGADSAARRAKDLLDNLGFSAELQARSLSQLSGGWRVRTMLAAAIFAKPDVLLLDEPTNHLSILAVLWLARELSTSETWKERIVVLVSHDKHFLDEVCTDCLHVSGAARKLTQSRGNYSTWRKRRQDEQALFLKEQAKKKDEINRLKDYAGHGFKYGGSSSQINKMSMKAKQAEKLEREYAEHATELAALQEDIELCVAFFTC